ncbi:MAG: aminoacyl-tRNA hydrolase, partial [Capnocytophaga granulosa]
TSYARLRCGISANYAKGAQIDYVLGRWSEEEVALLPERLEKISEAILSFGLAGADTTMNLYNNK